MLSRILTTLSAAKTSSHHLQGMPVSVFYASHVHYLVVLVSLNCSQAVKWSGSAAALTSRLQCFPESSPPCLLPRQAHTISEANRITTSGESIANPTCLPLCGFRSWERNLVVGARH